jgi:hypothetical protein
MFDQLESELVVDWVVGGEDLDGPGDCMWNDVLILPIHNGGLRYVSVQP